MGTRSKKEIGSSGPARCSVRIDPRPPIASEEALKRIAVDRSRPVQSGDSSCVQPPSGRNPKPHSMRYGTPSTSISTFLYCCAEGAPPTMWSTCSLPIMPRSLGFTARLCRFHLLRADEQWHRRPERRIVFSYLPRLVPMASQMSRRLAVPERPRKSAMTSATVRWGEPVLFSTC